MHTESVITIQKLFDVLASFFFFFFFWGGEGGVVYVCVVEGGFIGNTLILGANRLFGGT